MTDINVALKEISSSLQALVQIQTKGVTGTANWQPIHGPLGLFSPAGISDLVINAQMTPRGLDQLLPAFGTQDTNPLYAYLTGFDPDGSAEPSTACGNCPSVVMETCMQTAAFGRYCRESQEMDVTKLALRTNRGETMGLRLLGDVLGPHSMTPAVGDANWLEQVIKTQMVMMGWGLQSLLVPQLWQGNPANNLGTGYAEFPGLDILIATGKIDAITNTTCPALDPDVKDFGYTLVNGTFHGQDIVAYISMMEIFIRHNAERMGLMPVEWVICMRPELFFELTAYWPCQYLTDRCADLSGAQITVLNDRTNTDLRDDMRNGKYLLVNGRQIPVVTDDGIFESNSTNDANCDPGEFASDIYFVPLRAQGIPTTYWEFVNYDQSVAQLGEIAQRTRYWVTDGGRYIWNFQDSGLCFIVQAHIEPRVILLTPQIAGRLTDVKYSPLQHLRSPDPDSPYRAKGGVEEYPGPSFYSQWDGTR